MRTKRRSRSMNAKPTGACASSASRVRSISAFSCSIFLRRVMSRIDKTHPAHVPSDPLITVTDTSTGNSSPSKVRWINSPRHSPRACSAASILASASGFGQLRVTISASFRPSTSLERTWYRRSAAALRKVTCSPPSTAITASLTWASISPRKRVCSASRPCRV